MKRLSAGPTRVRAKWEERVHYCQSCDRPVVMAHDGDEVVCPVCGRRDPARRMPLFLVTGASAVGKTTLHVPLAEELAGEAAVFDSDWLIDPFGRAAGDRGMDWDALLQGWAAVSHGLAQQGRATVLLGSFGPERIEALPNRGCIETVHCLLLDCDDAVRRERLDARPAWRGRDVEAQTAWAQWLREHIEVHVRTDLLSLDETVAQIAAWVRAVLSASERPADRPLHR